ncbi:DUF4112 domain-containing protein [Roseivirga sp. BDSF3-8]|uniref:DUF4112 domain-containing protein n=1 Tax=Roseivirga sp. BDSF3-8 TaxID=3241598 RepID=UPI003531CBA0
MTKTQRLRQLEWAEKVAYFLDSKYRLPGTKFRFGLDPILGLLPVLGDGVSFIISSLLVVQAARTGVSGKVLLKMTGNVLLDFIVGSVPVLGNIFDFVYKANTRNIRLLREYYNEGKHKGSGIGILIVLLLTFILIIAAIAAIISLAIRWAADGFAA